MQAIRLAIRDLSDGLANWPLWLMLGWHDIRLRYRRSVIGPFWLTISLGIWVATIGTLFTKIMGIPAAVYIPHLALGLLAWTMIS
ncbi:MAG: ABC transporter permease, partial [bacterium]